MYAVPTIRSQKNYCNRSPACVKCAKNHLTRHCPYTGKIEVRCYNCNGNHQASYKGCEIRKQLKLFPPLRNRSFNNYQPQQSITDNDTTLKTQYELNAINRNIDPKGNRSYAQVTQNIGQATLTNNQNQSNNIEDVTEIKEMLRQSIKSTEMLGKMVSELNTILRQQVQQTTVMLQLLTNLLSKK